MITPSRIIAEKMFAAYRNKANGLTYDGRIIPEWAAIPDNIKECWVEAAIAARDAIREGSALDEREISQLKLAQYYVRNHSTAGIVGHTSLILLAKLAAALGFK